ncbi:MAG TPA: flagellar type III secretion system protein FliR [Firmicutes bacterium]|jgi:flagellar biosynthetic protein FliR|nr:flagellar type III secretion system protein FliR [Bacillota bacterium]
MGTLCLAMVRITAFFVTAPFFGVKSAPLLLKAALGLLIAVLFWPFLPPTELSGWGLILAALSESVLGLALGYLVSLVFSAIQIAGQLLDVQMGLAMAGIFDPQNAFHTTLVGQFLSILGLLLFFLVDGHHVLLLGLQESFQLLPPGKMALGLQLAGVAAEFFCQAFTLAVRVASPVIAVLVVADLALSLVARTVPQLNVFILGFPLKAGLGMIVLLAILPLLVTAFTGLFGQLEQDLLLLLRGWANDV